MYNIILSSQVPTKNNGQLVLWFIYKGRAIDVNIYVCKYIIYITYYKYYIYIYIFICIYIFILMDCFIDITYLFWYVPMCYFPNFICCHYVMLYISSLRNDVLIFLRTSETIIMFEFSFLLCFTKQAQMLSLRKPCWKVKQRS